MHQENKAPSTQAHHMPPPLIVAGATVMGLLLDRRSRTAGGSSSPRLKLAGRSAVVAGLTCIAAAAASMFRAGNNPDPRRDVVALNDQGIYRMSRNPIYLGMILCQIGIGVLNRSRVTVLATIVSVGLLRWKVIAFEETFLNDRFGEDYRSYCQRVSRWLGPVR
ncbi:MAG: methyltransferase family protein [Ferrimicrobium sp.]